MKAKDYFLQIEPHIGDPNFGTHLGDIVGDIIREGKALAESRKIMRKDSLLAVYNECELKFQAVCRMIAKKSDKYVFDADLFRFIFELKFPDVYKFIYA